MKKFKELLNLFLTMFKIGVFTFGGGYAMIALFENEFITKKKWQTKEEFLDMVAIAESTPGPIAINSATYIGYKVSGFWGSLFATIGVVLPSFIIIFLISLFLNSFLEITLVQYAFKGIQACVVYLILQAGFKMLKSLKKDIFSICVLCVVVVCLISFSLFAIDFSTIFYILISAVFGLIYYGIIMRKKDSQSANKEPTTSVVEDKETSVTQGEETKEKEDRQ